jgi:hypothetical protein
LVTVLDACKNNLRIIMKTVTNVYFKAVGMMYDIWWWVSS